jgi:hypothetical protein
MVISIGSHGGRADDLSVWKDSVEEYSQISKALAVVPDKSDLTLGTIVEEEAEEEEDFDADYAAENTEDEIITSLAMVDPVRFGEKFAEAVAASGLDSNGLAAPVTDINFILSETSETYALRKLLAENDKYVP